MNYLLALYFIIVFGLSFIKSKDIFSISKIYLVILFAFFGQVFLEDQNPYVSILVFLLISITFIVFNFESDIRFEQEKIVITNTKLRTFSRRLWLLSLIPIFAQLYLIISIGDFSAFISSINSRVVSWQSYGAVIMLIKLINVINYLYFVLIIKFEPISKKHKLLYLAHLALFVGISLLAGSRSTLLWNFVFMLMFYNFFVKKVSLKFAFIGGVSILLVATFIGFLRNSGVKYENNLFSTQGNSESKMEFKNFSYGIEPLEKLMDQTEIINLEYGKTYLSAITNLIPRSLWPQKPPSGGVVITEKYFENRYDGYSYYTTGVLSEAIINFGFVGGIIFGFIQMIVLLVLLASYARKKISSINGNTNLFNISIYPFLLIGICSYLYAEFTTNTISLFVYKIFEFYIICKLTFGRRNLLIKNNR